MPDLNPNEQVEILVSDADVITVPIDDTLTHSGEAADAKAVGDALALKADASAVQTIKVNDQAADNQGQILLSGEDVPVSSDDSTTLSAAIEAIDEKTAADIPVSSDPDAQTIAQALAESVDKTADLINMSAADQTKVADRIVALEGNVSALAGSAVKSVNGETPDDTGNVALNSVPYADNLLSSGSQSSIGEFLIRASGGEASISNGDAMISSIRGNMVHSGYTPESITSTVSGNFTISIDRNTFVTVVTSSTTITLSYTTTWSTDPAAYGITVNGEPANGNSIVVTYVKEVRGTITPTTPQTFVSTGWNLYNRTAGYARVVNYSDTYGFRVGGTYTAVSFSATATGEQTALTVTNRGFSLPSGYADGYIFVSGSDATTEIYMTWSDWTTQANGGTHQDYTQSVVNLSGIMSATFPNGLLAVGDTHDEINFNTRRAYSRIERMAYNSDNLAAAIASGRAYEYDEYFIYLVRETAVESTLTEGLGKYTVNDHGIEFFTGATVAPLVTIVYSNDLKNKLERDVLTISQQTLTDTQKNLARTNISAASKADFNSLMNYIWYNNESGNVSRRISINSTYIVDMANNLVVHRMGYVVVVSIMAISVSLPSTWTEYVIASNLPKPHANAYIAGTLGNQEGPINNIYVTANGDLMARSDSRSGGWLRGQLIYLSTEEIT